MFSNLVHSRSEKRFNYLEKYILMISNKNVQVEPLLSPFLPLQSRLIFASKDTTCPSKAPIVLLCLRQALALPENIRLSWKGKHKL